MRQGLVGKNAIDAIDRAIRGDTSPSPVWEGDYGIIPILVKKDNKDLIIELPDKDEPRLVSWEHLQKNILLVTMGIL